MLPINVVNWPYLAELSYTRTPLVYTEHALLRCQEKRLPVLKTLTINQGSVVEVQSDNRLVVRMKGLLNEYDLILVVRQIDRGWLCLTSYKNHKDDNHATLKIAERR